MRGINGELISMIRVPKGMDSFVHIKGGREEGGDRQFEKMGT